MEYDREWLKDYFTYDWVSSRTAGLDGYYYTGWRLIDEINDTESVLDVGCGVNPFKRHIKNLHGIDITDIGSDEQVAIEDYESDTRWDVAFCLGSINFGDIELISAQVRNLVRHMKPKSRIYWRCNPGHRDHGNDNVSKVPFFEWEPYIMENMARQYGYEISERMPDNNRLYFKWERVKEPDNIDEVLSDIC